jgi:hypothetical protein
MHAPPVGAVVVPQDLALRVLSRHLEKPTTTRVSTRWESKNLSTGADGQAMLQYAATDAHASRLIYVAIRDGLVPAVDRRVGGQVDDSTQAQSNRLTDELLRHMEIQENNATEHVGGVGIDEGIGGIGGDAATSFDVQANGEAANVITVQVPNIYTSDLLCMM